MKHFTKTELAQLDSIKVLNSLLGHGADVKVTSKDNNWSVKIDGGKSNFSMSLRYWMTTDALEVLEFGIRTWSLTVTNLAGNIVMSSSNVHPSESTELGRICRRHIADRTVCTKKSDWKELEEFANL